MANFSEVPWIAEHIALYRSDPEKAPEGRIRNLSMAENRRQT